MANQNESAKPAKNGEIEVWRFLFAVGIVAFHCGWFLGWEHPIYARGYLGVEFFFLLSGYFLNASFRKQQATDSVFPLLKKKIGAIFPELLISCVIGCLFVKSLHLNTESAVSMLLQTFTKDILLLDMTGLCYGSPNAAVNGVVWYLSSMLIAIVVLHCYWKKRGTDTLLFVLSLLLFGYLIIGTEGHISSPRRPVGGIYSGNIRALAEMGLGMCAYEIARYMREIPFSRLARACFTLLKWGLLLILFNAMRCYSSTPDSLWMLGAWLLLILTLSNLCIDGSLWQRSWCFSLGKMSLPLFLSHIFYAYHWHRLPFADFPFPFYIGSYFLAAGATALTTAGTAAIWRKKICSKNGAENGISH